MAKEFSSELLISSRGHFYIYDKAVITTFMELAMAQLASLGLNKPPPKESPHTMLHFDGKGCPRPLISYERTLEDRRAALACFLVSSV